MGEPGNFLYNINPVHILKGQTKGCGGQKHDRVTLAEKVIWGAEKLISKTGKGIGSIFTPKPTPHHKRDNLKPLQPKTELLKTEIKPPEIKPPAEKPPVETPPAEKTTPESYDNFADSHVGYSYQDGKINVVKRQLPALCTVMAFNSQHDDRSTVTLAKGSDGKVKKEVLERMFDDFTPSNQASQKNEPLTKEKYNAFIDAYQNNVSHKAGQCDTDRIKTNTVQYNEKDKQHMEDLFNAMATKTKDGKSVVTKENFVKFYQETFSKYGTDGNKLTRASMEDAVQDKLKTTEQ